jgi:hypothetical protein
MYIFDVDHEAYTVSRHAWPRNITLLYVDINKVESKVVVSFAVKASCWGEQIWKPISAISLVNSPPSRAFRWDESWVQRVKNAIEEKTGVPLRIIFFRIETEGHSKAFKDLCIGDRVQTGKEIICYVEYWEFGGN